ncbi:Diacylglycerol kinase zeta [Echinococcus multilocularis]|uniref:Diacylglycerol kinase n=1 Tax=Echinococcus multilocularis TaxID=6211 RepID=A0A087VXZ4_ECHMU|nr:Diacylglycerol kinase zeta [Echinococcus multilocularis]
MVVLVQLSLSFEMLISSAGSQNSRHLRRVIKSRFFDSDEHNDYQLNTEDNSNDTGNNSATSWSISMPKWTTDEKPDCHLWYDTAASGEYCYVSDSQCTKAGPRKKCSSCRIICHTACIPRLDAKCKPTFRRAVSSTYRNKNDDQTVVRHHWVLRRQKEDRCQACGRWIQAKFKFRDTLYMQCSWCHLCFHNKPECFDSSLLTVSCQFGKHAKLIIPPTWIVKMPNEASKDVSFCRSPSNPAFSLAPVTLKPSASVEVLDNRHHNSNFTDDFVVTTSASATGLSRLPSPLASPRPVSSATCDFPFVVKPSCRSATCPLVVFINPKAGGNQGVKLLKKFQGLLNPRQIFSLTEVGPRLGLELFGRLPNVRVLVCGGDGTVGWILSEIDSLDLHPTPPVAILPLGTGNDLARTLQWGSGYVDEPLTKILTSVEEGRVVLLDRWNIKSRLLTSTEFNLEDDIEMSSFSGGGGVQMSDKLPLNVMNNYFSLGADAATALEFHESREANPDRFNSRLKNKIFYAGVGGMDLIRRSWRDLSDYVTLECDGVDMSHKLKELRPHVLLFLNIPKYSAGTDPWGHSSDPELQQSIDDKKLEVIGLTTATLATLQMGGHGDRICQCSEAHLITRKTIPMQIDGEPCRLAPSTIDIRLCNQVFVVQKTRRVEGSSPAHFDASGRLVKIFIIYPGHNEVPESLDHLCKTAQRFASLRIGAYADLNAVRRQIKHSRNPPNSSGDAASLPNKWIFLDLTAINGQVYGIDPHMESAHFITDILSNDNELFLISQDGMHEKSCSVGPFFLSEDISRKTSDSSQMPWDICGPVNAKVGHGHQMKRIFLHKSLSAEFHRREVFKKVSFTAHLGTSFSCPNLSDSTAEGLSSVYPQAEYRNRYDEDEGAPDDIDNDGANTTSSIASTQYGCFPDWRHWRRMPPKILVSLATSKRIKESSVGVAPNPVQSLNCLSSVAETPSHARDIPLAKISVTSDPGFALNLHGLVKNKLQAYYLSACRSGHIQGVQSALEAGLSPMVVDHITGKSGLHHAAKFGRLNVVQYLIENAPKELLELRDYKRKQTALHKAAASKRRRICEILVRAGACTGCGDANGDTPSALALLAGDKKLAHFLQKEELMQLIKRSNEELPSSSAKLTSLSNLVTVLPRLP